MQAGFLKPMLAEASIESIKWQKATFSQCKPMRAKLSECVFEHLRAPVYNGLSFDSGCYAVPPPSVSIVPNALPEVVDPVVAENSVLPLLTVEDTPLAVNYIPAPLWPDDPEDDVLCPPRVVVEQDTIVPEVVEKLTLVERFLRFIDSFAKEQETQFVSLGMWHDRYSSRLKTGDNLVPIASERYPDERWQLKTMGDVVVCERVPITALYPESGGPSNVGNYAYGSDENRPVKTLTLSAMMDVRTLVYVDMELYAHLKSFNMALGTVAETHGKLHREANTFLKQYRVNHLDRMLLLEVIHWTVAAAMIPTRSEVLCVDMMTRAGLYRDINKVTRFKRQGETSKRRWFGFLPNKILKMYKPPVA